MGVPLREWRVNPLLLAVVAESGLPTASLPQNPELIFLAYFVGCSIMLFGGAVSLVTIWDKLRKKPPVEDVYATIVSMNALEERSNNRAKENGMKIDALDRRLENELANFERRITGNMADNRSNNEHRFGELGGKFDSLNSAFQQLSNDLFRSIGQLEGGQTKKT